MPESLGANLDRVDWIPVDQLAAVLFELMSSEQHETQVKKAHSDAVVFNIVNPHPTQWQKLLPGITTSLSSLSITGNGKASLQQVSFETWIQKVRSNFESRVREAEAKNGDEELEAILEANPAAKLLGFYEEARMQPPSMWKTENSRGASSFFISLSSVKAEWMERWLKFWLSGSSREE